MFTLLLKEELRYLCTKLYAKIKNNFALKSHTHTKSQISDFSHTHTKSQISDFPSSLPANGGNAATVNGHTVETNVPSNAKFTDTTYGVVSTTANGLCPKRSGTTTKFFRDDGTWATPPNTTYGLASQSSNGLMSAADKKLLDELVAWKTKVENGESNVLVEN